jgi:hypothetical protein
MTEAIFALPQVPPENPTPRDHDNSSRTRKSSASRATGRHPQPPRTRYRSCRRYLGLTPPHRSLRRCRSPRHVQIPSPLHRKSYLRRRHPRGQHNPDQRRHRRASEQERCHHRQPHPANGTRRPRWCASFQATPPAANPSGTSTQSTSSPCPQTASSGKRPPASTLGLVLLNQSPGDTLGWFGWQSSTNADSYKGNWTSAGYAAEKFSGEQAIAWGVNITDVNEDVEASGLDFELISPGYASAPWVGGPLWHLGGDLLPYVNGVVSGNRNGRTVHAGGPLMGSFISSHT